MSQKSGTWFPQALMPALQRCPPRIESESNTTHINIEYSQNCFIVSRDEHEIMSKDSARVRCLTEAALHSKAHAREKMNECHQYLRRKVSYASAVTSPPGVSNHHDRHPKIEKVFSPPFLPNRSQKMFARIARGTGKPDSTYSATILECGR